MINIDFFQDNVIEVAQKLIGCRLIRLYPNGSLKSYLISETEAYCGENDSACYARKGRNTTSELLYHQGGTIFVHRCYGIHWLLNIVTGDIDDPQGVLVRGIDDIHGPGRVTKELQIDDSYNGHLITQCPILFIEKSEFRHISFEAFPRIGISYASTTDREKPLRFLFIQGE